MKQKEELQAELNKLEAALVSNPSNVVDLEHVSVEIDQPELKKADERPSVWKCTKVKIVAVAIFILAIILIAVLVSSGDKVAIVNTSNGSSA